jgi:hypothetical protein
LIKKPLSTIYVSISLITPVTIQAPTRNIITQRSFLKSPFGLAKNRNREIILRPKCATNKRISPRPTKYDRRPSIPVNLSAGKIVARRSV